MASRSSDSQRRSRKVKAPEFDGKATVRNVAEIAARNDQRTRLPTPLRNPAMQQVTSSAQSNTATDWEQPAVTAPNALKELPLRRLQPTLCILSSNVYAGVEILIDRKLRIGRDPENDIRLPGDASMSRNHAIITPTPEGLFLEDAGSTNGTLLNGALVTRAPLNHNDRIRIGDTMFQVRYEPRRAMSQATPPPTNATNTMIRKAAAGDSLRAWRRDRGLTQTELASQLGVSQRTISLWEQGAPISPENLRNLREKGGCDVL